MNIRKLKKNRLILIKRRIDYNYGAMIHITEFGKFMVDVMDEVPLPGMDEWIQRCQNLKLLDGSIHSDSARNEK